MIFFDTNVLVYATINQDSEKQDTADQRIRHALASDRLIISPLILSELTFVLAKLEQLQHSQDAIELFQSFSTGAITVDDTLKAKDLVTELNCGRSINDAIHLKHAERVGCTKLITFDKGFSRFRPYTSLELDIL